MFYVDSKEEINTTNEEIYASSKRKENSNGWANARPIGGPRVQPFISSCLYRRFHCDIRKPTCRFQQHVVLSHRFDNYILLNSVFVQIRGKEGRCDSEKGDEMFAIVRQTMRTPSPTFIHLLTLKENHPAARPRCNGAIIFFIACLNVYKKAKKLNLETFYVLMDIR